MSDVIVVGAGVIGTSIALALARRGASVRLLDRGAIGADASSAAAGVIGAQHDFPDDSPLARLCFASLDLYPRWIDELAGQTGIDVGYRRVGALFVALAGGALDEEQRAGAWQLSIGRTREPLSSAGARSLEPNLSPDIAGALRFAADARIDPATLLRALRVAAPRAGALVRVGACVRRVLVDAGRALGVVLEDGSTLRAPTVVIAAGSYSALIDGSALPDGSVRPARGQIVELEAAAPPVRHVIYGPSCYLSPRDDGRVLVGSTCEDVGFRPGVTASAVRSLLDAAIRIVPSLGDAAIRRTWSGFRPRALGDLPLIGPTSIDGLLVATGHFRSGVILAPVTAEIITTLIEGSSPPFDLTPFSVARLEQRSPG